MRTKLVPSALFISLLTMSSIIFADDYESNLTNINQIERGFNKVESAFGIYKNIRDSLYLSDKGLKSKVEKYFTDVSDCWVEGDREDEFAPATSVACLQISLHVLKLKLEQIADLQLLDDGGYRDELAAQVAKLYQHVESLRNVRFELLNQLDDADNKTLAIKTFSNDYLNSLVQSSEFEPSFKSDYQSSYVNAYQLMLQNQSDLSAAFGILRSSLDDAYFNALEKTVIVTNALVEHNYVLKEINPSQELIDAISAVEALVNFEKEIAPTEANLRKMGNEIIVYMGLNQVFKAHEKYDGYLNLHAEAVSRTQSSNLADAERATVLSRLNEHKVRVSDSANVSMSLRHKMLKVKWNFEDLLEDITIGDTDYTYCYSGFSEQFDCQSFREIEYLKEPIDESGTTLFSSNEEDVPLLNEMQLRYIEKMIARIKAGPGSYGEE